MKNILFIIIGFFCLCSCYNRCEKTQKEIKSIMQNWYKKDIIFPTKMKKFLYQNSTHTVTSSLSQPTLHKYTIVHFFTADCDKCIHELEMIQTFLKSNSFNKSINYVFIASAPTPIYIENAIKETEFPYPIFYEKEYFSFKRINDLPIYDNVFNTMLLNGKNQVILFGAFYNNQKAKNLYKNAIDCNL